MATATAPRWRTKWAADQDRSLGGAPEFAVADGNGTVFANLADKDQIVAIDTRSLRVKARWPTAPEGEPTALASDRRHRRLFSAGRKPQQLIVMDADGDQIIKSFPIGSGTDAVAFDRQTPTVFVSTRDAKLHQYHEDSPDSYRKTGTVATEFGAPRRGTRCQNASGVPRHGRLRRGQNPRFGPCPADRYAGNLSGAGLPGP